MAWLWHNLPACERTKTMIIDHHGYLALVQSKLIGIAHTMNTKLSTDLIRRLSAIAQNS